MKNMNLIEAVKWVEIQPVGTRIDSTCGGVRLVRDVDTVELYGRLNLAVDATWTRPRRKGNYLEAVKAVLAGGRAFQETTRLSLDGTYVPEHLYVSVNGGEYRLTIKQQLGEWEIEDAA